MGGGGGSWGGGCFFGGGGEAGGAAGLAQGLPPGVGLAGLAELAACGHGFEAAGFADGGVDVVVEEEALEAFDVVAVGALELDPRKGVPRDQVDFMGDSGEDFE